MRIGHLIALDDLGGLQTLFMAFAEASVHRGERLNIINRGSGRPLPEFDRKLRELGLDVPSPRAGLVPSLGRSAAFRGVRGLQQITNYVALRRHIRRLERGNCLDRLILWNSLPSHSMTLKSGDLVVYDHGMSSIHRPTANNRERLRRAAKVIAVSAANAYILRERWGWTGVVATIMNPLRSEISRVPLAAPMARRDGKCLWLGCACRLLPIKGIASLVASVDELRRRGLDVRLRLAGDGGERERLAAAAVRRGIAGYVDFVGVVNDMPAFFSSIDIFVAPSLREPFGLSPLEALACGIPTVLSSVDGHPEVLPFADAAKLIEPTLPLAQYESLGSSLDRIPPHVYSPVLRRLVRPKALDPAAIADAVEEIVEDYDGSAATAFRAGQQIRLRNDLSSFTERLDRIVSS